MASCALNDLNAWRGGEEPPDVQLAVDYPAYAMVICQHSHIKDVNNICWLIPW